MLAMPLRRQLQVLLGYSHWGDRHVGVDESVQRYLAGVLAVRRGHGAGRQVAGAATVGCGDVACQICHRRTGASTMLLCDACDRGFHMRCLTLALAVVPEGQLLVLPGMCTIIAACS